MRYIDDDGCDIRYCKGCSYCSDAYGVDAMKDANAEAGRRWDDSWGEVDAAERGWFRGPTY